MSQLVKRSSLLFTVLVGFSLLFNPPLLVYAQSQDDKIPTTDTLTVKYPKSPSVEVTDSYLSRVFDKGRWGNEEAYSKGSSLVKDALKSGSIGVFQFSGKNADGDLYTYVRLIVSSGSGPAVISKSFVSGKAVFNFLLPAGSLYYFIDVSPKLTYFSGSSGQSNFLMYSEHYTLFSYSGRYSFESSSGLQGDLPRRTPFTVPGTSNSFTFNDGCGLDIACHLGNVSNFIKALFSFIVGIFDFSENNSILQLLKWLFIPDDVKVLFDFSDLSDHFRDSLNPVFSAVDLLKRFYGALSPSKIIDDSGYYCRSGLSPTHPDSGGHIYILNTTIFGEAFRPDICSFERLIGGPYSMQKVRVFTSIFLFLLSLFIWYKFLNKVIGGRL